MHLCGEWHVLPSFCCNDCCFILQPRKVLFDSWQLKQASTASHNVQVAAFGRLCVRCILHLTDKAKMGKEPKGFTDFHEIAQLFAQELQKGKVEKIQASDSGKAASSLTVENTIGASAAQVALLQNSHLQIGKLQLGKHFSIHMFLLGCIVKRINLCCAKMTNSNNIRFVHVDLQVQQCQGGGQQSVQVH